MWMKMISCDAPNLLQFLFNFYFYISFPTYIPEDYGQMHSLPNLLPPSSMHIPGLMSWNVVLQQLGITLVCCPDLQELEIHYVMGLDIYQYACTRIERDIMSTSYSVCIFYCVLDVLISCVYMI